jgi:hypothetical protein
MKVKYLLEQWEKSARVTLTARRYAILLPLQDAARIAALADIYPRMSEEQIITDLLSAALDEVAAAMPYVQGEHVISEDDQGDPIYEDVGPTPRFHSLTQHHARMLERESKQK